MLLSQVLGFPNSVMMRLNKDDWDGNPTTVSLNVISYSDEFELFVKKIINMIMKTKFVVF